MKWAFAFFDKFSLCSLVTLGTGTNKVVPSCCGLRFIPDSDNAFKVAGRACGNATIFIAITFGFFLTI
uniref:Uncharacterized protein n=1 Tax=Panstrongylus lignarius TaxID=156445 RepID=A0A224XYB3_9HEMI